MQQKFGNSYVNEFIGNQIIAARGHNSPPATGPGSHGDPLKVGKGGTLTMAAMKSDAYHASPINPHNPVVIWTDGTSLFFAPSQEQVTAGRTAPTPEPVFVPPPGYKAEEIHWDRGSLFTGGGSLVVVARKAGADDVEVVIFNTLEQKSFFTAGGLTTSASSTVAREGGQFLFGDETNVPLEISGATATGAIHGVTFPDGFFRYRAPGGTHDLYVAKGAAPFAHLVERSTGAIKQTFASGTIAAVVPETSAVVALETSATGKSGAVAETTTIDLSTDPPKVVTKSGHASAESTYDDVKKRLLALDVVIEETGVRFRVAELEAVEDALMLGGGRGLTALKEFAKLEGTLPTILSLSKAIGSSAGGGSLTVGGGVPTLSSRDPFEPSSTERVATMRHEMTHIIMDAIDVVARNALTAAQRADLGGAMRFEARVALDKAKAGKLRQGEQGAGDPRPGPGSISVWRGSVGQDPELADVWIELLRRYGFITDPEGTGELRGVSLADESRYSGSNDPGTGHPADSVFEFIASFVTCATLFKTAFVADVLASETAGNAKGGGGGTYLRRLYRKTWNLISAKYVPLGSNPF
jgi:hypothetical protein